MARRGAVALLVLLSGPALGQHRFGFDEAGAERLVAESDEPVGPCSPYRAEDGDIPSEMPGCARRRRPVPGSLADELQFRRGAHRSDGWETDPADHDPPRRVKRGRPARPDDSPDPE